MQTVRQHGRLPQFLLPIEFHQTRNIGTARHGRRALRVDAHYEAAEKCQVSDRRQDVTYPLQTHGESRRRTRVARAEQGVVQS